MKPVRIAVVGVGSLGQHHARKLAESPGVVLAGVADPNEVAGRQVAMQHGVEWCASFQQLPAGLDGVIIASPTIYHAEAATYFLQQGIATFVEKPLAPSAEQAESLWRLAAEHDALLRSIGSNTGRLTSVDRDYDPYTGIPRMSCIPVEVTAWHGDLIEARS